MKTPYFISLKSGMPFALGALWEHWRGKEGDEFIQSTTLITTAANDFMRPMHHRMPMILESEAANDWLGGDMSMLDNAAAKCPPLRAWPVDRRVNNARVDDDGLIDPDGDILSD